MPLFGKKSKPAKMSGADGKPYPTAQSAYPTASGGPAYRYPGQPQGYPAPSPYQQPVQPQGPYGQPPPSYSSYPQAPQPAPQPMVQAQGVFDQGARFRPGQPVHVPPPPPGVQPTAAQIAAQQGQSVAMSQQKRDVWGMGSDGGYSMF